MQEKETKTDPDVPRSTYAYLRQASRGDTKIFGLWNGYALSISLVCLEWSSDVFTAQFSIESSNTKGGSEAGRENCFINLLLGPHFQKATGPISWWQNIVQNCADYHYDLCCPFSVSLKYQK